MSQYENPWTYDDKIFDSDLIGDYYGFVYLITGKQTGRRYIGRKYFWQKENQEQDLREELRPKVIGKNITVVAQN